MPSTSSGSASPGGIMPQSRAARTARPVADRQNVALPAARGLHGHRKRRAAGCCASRAPPAHRSRPPGTGRRARRASVPAADGPSRRRWPARSAMRWTRAAAARRPGVAAQSAPVTANAQSSSKRSWNGKSWHLDRRPPSGRCPAAGCRRPAPGGPWRPRDADAPAQGAEAAQVLHRSQRAGGQDLDHRITFATRKRMLSPGCSKRRRVARGVEEAHRRCCRSCSSRSGRRRPTRRSARRRSTPRRPGMLQHRHLAPRRGDARIHAAEVAIARMAAERVDRVERRAVDRRRSRRRASPVWATTSAMCGPALAAIGDRQFEHAALAAEAARPRPRQRAAAPRARRVLRGGRAKVSIRLFMPGTASRMSGQVSRLAGQRPDPALRSQRRVAGRLEQQRGGAEQADGAAVALMRLPRRRQRFEMVDVDAASGEARVAARCAGAAAGWLRCPRPASRQARPAVAPALRRASPPCTISLAISRVVVRRHDRSLR